MLYDKNEAASLIALLHTTFAKDQRVSVFDLLHDKNPRIAALGNTIVEKVFLRYTAKQWGVPIDKVERATINRVPALIAGYDDRYFQDAIQMMPSGGFSALFDKMLDHENIDVLLNTNVNIKTGAPLSFDLDTKQIYYKDVLYNGLVFFTGALDDFFDYKYGELPYRSLDLSFERRDVAGDLAGAYFQDAAVVNYPNDEAFTRITEFKRFMQRRRNGNCGQTIILKEYPKPYTRRLSGEPCEPYYPIINDENRRIYARYVEALKSFANVHLCGRLAEYKYYNMDAVVESALAMATTLINSTSINLTAKSNK
jgi:UDP-galactopyranose mutase